jgi:sRNA-binding protein
MTSTTDNAATPAAPRKRGRRRQNPGPAGAQNEAQQAGQKTEQQEKAGPKAARVRKVHPVLERLFELYPKMFGARFLPLKLGVYQELLALHPDEFKKEDLKVALGLHARSTRYLEAVAAGEKRHDLNGMAVEDVAPEHVHHAILEVFKRRQARSGEDQRPKLRARLVEAIEASALSREAYTLAVRSSDPASNEVLDEAFAEVAARAAKREALLRAYEASGRTVAEFAEMYGMDPAETSRTLERARASRRG